MLQMPGYSAQKKISSGKAASAPANKKGGVQKSPKGKKNVPPAKSQLKRFLGPSK